MFQNQAAYVCVCVCVHSCMAMQVSIPETYDSGFYHFAFAVYSW